MAKARITYLSDTEKEFVHQKTLEVLEKVGVAYNTPKAIELLEAAGARVDREALTARLTWDVIEPALKTVPRTVLLAGRDPVAACEAVAVLREGFGMLLRSIYPATPHLTHALWVGLGYAGQFGDLLDAPWPKADESALLQDEIELVLQINGKLRGKLRAPASADRQTIEQLALAHEATIRLLEGKPAKKVVVVPGKLVNVVI